MARLREWCIAQRGAVRLLLACVLGGLAALSMPPVYAVPVLAPALVGLHWLVQSSPRPRAAMGLGWAFGFGFFLVGLYWIGGAFMVDASRHALFAIPAVVGLAGFLGLFVAVACWIQRHVIRHDRAGIGGVLVFASLWTLSEWLRSWVLTGFPWNLLGSVWAFSDVMIQPAAYLGTYGLSLITVFVFCYPAVTAEDAQNSGTAGWRTVCISVGVLAALWIGGAVRLSGAEMRYVPDVRLRLVQPNIPQAQKWKAELRSGHVLRQLDMSLNGKDETTIQKAQTTEMDEAPTHVIWAETAIPYVLSQETALIDLVAAAAPTNGALITGSVRSEAVVGANARPNYWNSLFVINASGDVVTTYDKVHLVPFGEYMPLQDILPLEKLTAGGGRFTPGAGRPSIDVPGLPPFNPLICYEIIFPGAVATETPRPSWLLNLTNDAWYGMSAGPYQHFVSARMRAVEEGLPVVRVANTGISGVIDGYGRVVRALGLGQAGVIDASLPMAISPTPFSRYHNFLPGVICIITFLSGLVLYRRRRNPVSTQPG